MTPRSRNYPAILVGGGPAGLAVLLNADKDGTLRTLLQRGLLLVERSPTLGCGTIGQYVINSDSTGATFLDPLHNTREQALRNVLQTKVAKRIACAAQGAVPLQDVGELMRAVGAALCTIIAKYPRSRVLTCSSVDSAHLLPQGGWRVAVSGAHGATLSFETSHLVLATGASQPTERLAHERVAGIHVSQRWGNQLVQSGELLQQTGLQAAANLLRGKANPNVAILGGSTSAVAVAHALLHRTEGVAFGTAGITLFHRRPLRVYYGSPAEAHADGYHDFGPEDVCPVSGRVYRFAGLRLDSRELLMQMYGLAQRAQEPRVAMHQLRDNDTEAVRRIDGADLVVAAFGYRPTALPLFDDARQSIPLLAQTCPTAPLVDEACRLLKADGKPLQGVYGIGLAAGFRPSGKFGGEPSFSGQANGLWLWQNGIGAVIVDALLAAPDVPSSSASPVIHARGMVPYPAMRHA